jgi:DNA-binding CsgD family transcriptional regulator
MANLLVKRFKPDPRHALSPRELEVMRWVAEGKTAEEIAEIMSLSTRTVTFHTIKSVSKLGASNKTAAAIRAAMLGLLY